MGIQSEVNKVIKDVSVLTSEKENEELHLQKEMATFKRKQLAYKQANLALKEKQLDAKRAAFERSLERKSHSLERVANGKALNSYQQELLKEAKRKREERMKLHV